MDNILYFFILRIQIVMKSFYNQISKSKKRIKKYYLILIRNLPKMFNEIKKMNNKIFYYLNILNYIKIMDDRPYFFVLNNNNWCFIARNMSYYSKIPLEKWITKDNEYTIYRKCYSKSEASKFVKKIPKNSFDGPELYYIYEKNDNKNYGVVYHPPNQDLEFEFKRNENNSSTLIRKNISFKQLKEIIIKNLKIEIINIENYVEECNKEFII